MGFLDWLFRRNNSEKIQESKSGGYDLESSKSLIQKKVDEETNSFWPKIEKHYSDLKSRNEEFKKSVETLRNAKPPEKIDEQILKIANTSRNTFIAKMSAVSDIIQRDFSRDIESFSDYRSTIASAINQVNKDTVKEFTSLNVAYDKETNNVVNKLREIKEKIDGFSKELSERKGKIDSFENLLNDIRALEEKEAENKKIGDEIEQVKKEMEKSGKEKNDSEKNLEELNKSEAWKDYIGLTKDKENLENSIRKIIEEVVSIFASLDRTLKKFIKLVDDKTVPFKNKETLKKYIESPFDGFIQDTDQETINSALMIIEDLIKNEKLVADNKNDSLRAIGTLKSSRMLETLSKQYHEKQDEMKNLKEKIDNHEYLKNRKELQDGISKISRRLEESKKTLQYRKNSKIETEKEIERMKEDLKIKLSKLQ